MCPTSKVVHSIVLMSFLAYKDIAMSQLTKDVAAFQLMVTATLLDDKVLMSELEARFGLSTFAKKQYQSGNKATTVADLL